MNEERDPPHEKPLDLSFDDWKEAVREFFRRQDADVKKTAAQEENEDDK